MDSIKQKLFDITRPIVSSLNIDDILEIELSPNGHAYEINGLPASNLIRANILSQIYSNLITEFQDINFELKQNIGSRSTASVKYKIDPSKNRIFGSKSGLIVAKQNRSIVYVIRTNKRIGARVAKLTPGNMGLSRGTDPLTLANYKTVSKYIELVESSIDQLISDERIPLIYGEWLRLILQSFNPMVNSSTMTRIQTLWSENPGMIDEINSEVLEIFCPLAYIKSLCGSSTLSGITNDEKNRVNNLIGKNSGYNYDDFRIWFPQGENFPIIDSQIVYIESNQIKAVFPISTKNITKGENTVNTLKFTDMFENGRQATNWYRHLPDKVKPKQQVQTCVAAESARRKSPTYVLEAMGFILGSSLVQQNHKSDLLGIMRQTFMDSGVEYTLTVENIRSLIKKISPNTTKQTKIDDISTLTNHDKTLAKLFVVSLIKNSRIYNSVSSLNQDRLVLLGENGWSQLRLTYPYTFQNLCLYFEKVLEKSSRQDPNGPKYNYQRIVKDNYFTGNKALITKYGDNMVAGAGEVIIAKARVDKRDGTVRIRYNTLVSNLKQHYGLRSKNNMNRLDDSLGVAP